MSRVFVDGAHGTVGMALWVHLAKLLHEGLLSHVHVLPPRLAKNTTARAEAMAVANIVVLCLPDEVSLDAARMAMEVNPSVRILDASAAHRCHDAWTYGLPEVTPAEEIRHASLVANPGCFATGCILLGAPLTKLLGRTESGRPWVPFQGITGYSAAGSRAKPSSTMPRLTQFGEVHRHLPEIARHAGVSPVLTTLIGDWYRGMLVQAALPLSAREVFEAYREAYAESEDVTVQMADGDNTRLSAKVNNETNKVSILVAKQAYGGTAVAAAYDNLGKGSAGAAAANLKLMVSPQ